MSYIEISASRPDRGGNWRFFVWKVGVGKAGDKRELLWIGTSYDDAILFSHSFATAGWPIEDVVGADEKEGAA